MQYKAATMEPYKFWLRFNLHETPYFKAKCFVFFLSLCLCAFLFLYMYVFMHMSVGVALICGSTDSQIWLVTGRECHVVDPQIQYKTAVFMRQHRLFVKQNVAYRPLRKACNSSLVTDPRVGILRSPSHTASHRSSVDTHKLILTLKTLTYPPSTRAILGSIKRGQLSSSTHFSTCTFCTSMRPWILGLSCRLIAKTLDRSTDQYRISCSMSIMRC